MKTLSFKSTVKVLGALLVGIPLWVAGSAPSGGSTWIPGGTSSQGNPMAAPASTPCAKTAQDTNKSCQFDANGDYYLALAICRNLTSEPQRTVCSKQAFLDSKDALAECTDQKAARLEVCEELGGGIFHPTIDPADFVTSVDNPRFPLTPGTILVYETHTPDGLERNEVRVTHGTKTILGVPCIVVHDVVALNGVVTEDTLDWYAQDRKGNVWYFGEESKGYEGDELVSIDGSWKAGRDGAQPGIVMEADPRVRDLYRQEFLPGEAEDMARVAGLNASVVVPYGSFSGLLLTQDFSPIEPDVVEQKFYAPGIGTVLEIDADGVRTELVDIITE